MPYAPNPVARLLVLAEAIRVVPQSERAKSGFEVWPAILGLPRGQAARELETFPKEGKNRDLMERLVAVQGVIDDAERLVGEMEGINHEFYLSEIRPLRVIFGPSTFAQPWELTQNLCSDVLLKGLAHVSELLNRHVRREEAVPEKDLAELLKAVDDLAATVRSRLADGKLPPALAEFLLRQLNAIHHAVSLYPLTGVVAIDEALQFVFGALFARRDVWKPYEDEGEIGAFWKVIAHLANVVTIATGVPQLGSGAWTAVKYLLTG